MCILFAIRALTSLLNASPKGSLWKMLIESMGSCIRNRLFFFLLPSEDGDLLHSQLFWETAGKIHFLFCWVPSKPHGWPSSVLWWSPPPSASWQPPLSQMLCFLLIITPQKFGYVLFIIHSFFFLSRWHHLHWPLQTSPESASTHLCQSWVSPDEKCSHYSKIFFPLFFLKVCCFVSY